MANIEFRVRVPDRSVKCGLTATGTNSANMKECVNPGEGCPGCRIFQYAVEQQRATIEIDGRIRRTPAVVNAVRKQF